VYVGGRAVAHQRAVALLNAHTYQQETPIKAGAFPTVSPLQWSGVVETEAAMHQAGISLLPGAEFDARAARSQFKPDNSQTLEHAIASDAAREFLAFARFPMARVEPAGEGFQVRIRDLREFAAAPGSAEIVAVIALNAKEEITNSTLQFETEPRR
jgi:hypothetical protein